MIFKIELKIITNHHNIFLISKGVKYIYIYIIIYKNLYKKL